MNLEKHLEYKLRDKVKQLGGLALKLIASGFTGLPDRMVLMPGGYIYFVELKGVEKQPRPRQLIVHAALRKLGFKVFVLYTKEDVNNFIEEINEAI